MTDILLSVCHCEGVLPEAIPFQVEETASFLAVTALLG